jgi:hypothetical protein
MMGGELWGFHGLEAAQKGKERLCLLQSACILFYFGYIGVSGG